MDAMLKDAMLKSRARMTVDLGLGNEKQIIVDWLSIVGNDREDPEVKKWAQGIKAKADSHRLSCSVWRICQEWAEEKTSGHTTCLDCPYFQEGIDEEGIRALNSIISQAGGRNRAVALNPQKIVFKDLEAKPLALLQFSETIEGLRKLGRLQETGLFLDALRKNTSATQKAEPGADEQTGDTSSAVQEQDALDETEVNPDTSEASAKDDSGQVLGVRDESDKIADEDEGEDDSRLAEPDFDERLDNEEEPELSEDIDDEAEGLDLDFDLEPEEETASKTEEATDNQASTGDDNVKTSSKPTGRKLNKFIFVTDGSRTEPERMKTEVARKGAAELQERNSDKEIKLLKITGSGDEVEVDFSEELRKAQAVSSKNTWPRNPEFILKFPDSGREPEPLGNIYPGQAAVEAHKRAKEVGGPVELWKRVKSKGNEEFYVNTFTGKDGEESGTVLGKKPDGSGWRLATYKAEFGKETIPFEKETHKSKAVGRFKKLITVKDRQESGTLFATRNNEQIKVMSFDAESGELKGSSGNLLKTYPLKKVGKTASKKKVSEKGTPDNLGTRAMEVTTTNPTRLQLSKNIQKQLKRFPIDIIGDGSNGLRVFTEVDLNCSDAFICFERVGLGMVYRGVRSARQLKEKIEQAGCEAIPGQIIAKQLTTEEHCAVTNSESIKRMTAETNLFGG